MKKTQKIEASNKPIVNKITITPAYTKLETTLDITDYTLWLSTKEETKEDEPSLRPSA